MNVNKLVESIVKPFLEEYLEPMDTPAVKNEDNYPLGECSLLKKLLSHSNIQPIQTLALHVPNTIIKSFMSSNYPNAGTEWEVNNKELADKIGYELIDYIGGDDREVPMNYEDEHTFMDTNGCMCEEYSARDKIRERILKKKFIKYNKGGIVSILKESFNVASKTEGGTRAISPFATLEGYKAFTTDRATNTGYQIVKELFDDKQVFAIDDIEVMMTSNTIKFFGDRIYGSNVVPLKEVCRKVGNLYQQYIKSGKTKNHNINEYHTYEDEISTDGSDTIEIFDGGIGKGGNKESNSGTPDMNNDAHKSIPAKDNQGDPIICKKPYTTLVNKNGEDEESMKQIKLIDKK